MLFASKEHKIVVVGPRKVGKSALVVRFLTKRFICEYVENTDMPCQRVTNVDGEQLKVHIQDTSDKGMTLASIEHYLRWADALMMIYSVTDADGFRQLKSTATKIIEKTNDLKEKEQKNIPPLVLVGNKGDLEIVRKVTRLEGLELAEKLRCEFFEASAREGWSKLLSNSTFSPPWRFSPCSDTDPGSNNATPKTSPRSSPFRLPPSPQKSAKLCDIGENNVISSEANGFARWGSIKNYTKIRRYGRSYSVTGPPPQVNPTTIPEINVSNTIARINSEPVSPACSRENLFEDDKTQILSRPKARLSAPTSPGIMGKLSPRLGRRFSRSSKKEKKNSIDDNNNNNNKRKKRDLQLSLSLNSIPDETEFDLTGQKLVLMNSSRPCSSSSCGSTESLASTGLDMESRLTDSPLFLSPPLSPDKFNNGQYQEQDFSSSEPFLFLCRIRPLQRARSRSRSPSNRLISGLKKIRSLAGDLNSPGLNSPKQSTNGTLLAAPPCNM